MPLRCPSQNDTREPELTSCASRNLSSVVTEEANTTVSVLLLTCDECANNGSEEPWIPSGRNHECEVPITEDAWLQRQASIRKGGFGIRDPYFSALLQPSCPPAAAHPPFATASAPTTPTWPLLRRSSAATSERTQHGPTCATHTHTHAEHCDGASHPRRPSCQVPGRELGW